MLQAACHHVLTAPPYGIWCPTSARFLPGVPAHGLGVGGSCAGISPEPKPLWDRDFPGVRQTSQDLLGVLWRGGKLSSTGRAGWLVVGRMADQKMPRGMPSQRVSLPSKARSGLRAGRGSAGQGGVAGKGRGIASEYEAVGFAAGTPHTKKLRIRAAHPRICFADREAP